MHHHGLKLDRKARKRKRKESKERIKRAVKKRRVALKEDRCKNQFQSTIWEGTTYERDVGLWNSSDVETPQVECLSELKSVTQIMIDVETTSPHW